MMARRTLLVEGVLIFVDEVTAVHRNRHDPAWSMVVLRSGKAVDVHQATPALIADIIAATEAEQYTVEHEYQLLDSADWPIPRP